MFTSKSLKFPKLFRFLHENQISGKIPNEIGNLTQLTIL